MLSKAIGLDPSSIGKAAFSRAVRSRLVELSHGSIDVYRAHLQSTPAEIQNLIEAVVVPETWFFREPEAFATMVKHVGGRATKDPTAVLRLLSVPCSTGEEPYSIAMALIDAGYPPDRFRIDAVDVSARAVAQALRGIYRKNSFRGRDLAFRVRHFETTPEGAVVTDAVKSRVRFERANLLDVDFIPGQKLYDVIFCRNMLIYFDDAARDKAVAVLNRLLADDGIIFVGPSESGLMLDHDLATVKAPLAFAFRKSSSTKLKPIVPPHVNQFLAPHSREVRRPSARVHHSLSAPRKSATSPLRLRKSVAWPIGGCSKKRDGPAMPTSAKANRPPISCCCLDWFATPPETPTEPPTAIARPSTSIPITRRCSCTSPSSSKSRATLPAPRS